MNRVLISRHQLVVLIIGFIYGVVINPAAAARQDAWLAILITSFAAFGVVLFYVFITLLNPGKTLIGILKEYFGEFMGGLVGLFYVWYFLHLAAIVIRNYGDFISITIFPETPLTFNILAVSLLIAYAVRQGLEVMARVSEIFVPFIPLEVVAVTLLLIPAMDTTNWKPFLEHGIMPVLEAVQILIGFPVGELVIFLMIFPHLNNKKELIKSALLAVFVIGTTFLIINVRDLFVLGGDMFYRDIYPSAIAVRLIPDINLDPFYLVAILIGGSLKVAICIYAAAMGLTEVFNLDNYKPFVLPLTALMVALSIWLYDSLFAATEWSIKNYFYYALPFQFIIPGALLVISLIKRRN